MKLCSKGGMPIQVAFFAATFRLGFAVYKATGARVNSSDDGSEGFFLSTMIGWILKELSSSGSALPVM